MSEEIKEIVKDNDELLVLYKDNSFITFDTLTVDVLDYIINLQQENQQLKDEIRILKHRNDFNESTLDTYEEIGEKYEKVLDEIRECTKELIVCGNEWCWDSYEIKDHAINLQSILDKVKE